METLPELVLFESGPQWRKWLSDHFDQLEGVWVTFAKKASDKKSMSYEEAVEEALCFGWIDGQVKKYDDDFYIQKFTPRRKNSVWSKINVSKAEALMANGKMQPSGLVAIEMAKENGQWLAAYDSPSTMEVPEDFQMALESSLKAKQFFQTLNKTNRYAYLWRVHTTLDPQKRKLKIEKLIQMLAAGKLIHE